MRRPGRAAFWVAFWLLLIFVTSSFFIESSAWVRFVQQIIGTGWAGTAFEDLWYSGGIFIVKGWHATEYAILFLLGASLLRRWTEMGAGRAAAWSLLFCVVFAASDEWHQTFVPGRDGCVRDVIIDTCGAVIAAWFYLRRAKRRERGRRTERATLVGRWKG